jgi:hypothetical protein
MALSLAQAITQIQSYIDFLHQYNRLPARSLKRFADRRAQRAMARTVPKANVCAWAVTSSPQCGFVRYPATPSKPCWGSTAGFGPLIRYAPSWATASRRR